MEAFAADDTIKEASFDVDIIDRSQVRGRKPQPVVCGWIVRWCSRRSIELSHMHILHTQLIKTLVSNNDFLATNRHRWGTLPSLFRQELPQGGYVTRGARYGCLELRRLYLALYRSTCLSTW